MISVVFELILNTNTYRAEKMSLYANDEYILGKGAILGKFDETETVSNPSIIFNKILDEIKKERTLIFIKKVTFSRIW
jgi:hypothetical protein